MLILHIDRSAVKYHCHLSKVTDIFMEKKILHKGSYYHMSIKTMFCSVCFNFQSWIAATKKTVQNTEISPNFPSGKFCGNSAETVRFHKSFSQNFSIRKLDEVTVFYAVKDELQFGNQSWRKSLWTSKIHFYWNP